MITHQIKSLQWQQKVGCLKKRGMNLWSLTSEIFFFLRAPFLALNREVSTNSSPRPEPETTLSCSVLWVIPALSETNSLFKFQQYMHNGKNRYLWHLMINCTFSIVVLFAVSIFCMLGFFKIYLHDSSIHITLFVILANFAMFTFFTMGKIDADTYLLKQFQVAELTRF